MQSTVWGSADKPRWYLNPAVYGVPPSLDGSGQKALREYVPPLPSAPPAKRKLIQSQQDTVDEVTTLMIRHLPCKLSFGELEVGERDPELEVWERSATNSASG